MFKTFIRLKIIFFSIILLLFIAGCKKEVVTVKSTSFNYFPVEIGHWVVYDVDSVFHADNDNENDDSVYSYHFQIMERIDSSFIDGAGREDQIIKRFRRIDSTGEWSISDIWTQTLSKTSAYKTENNVSFHKLAFPINSSVNWNGNDANTLDEEMYSYFFIHQPSQFNILHFDSTISVIQIDENNYVTKKFGNEIYATGVGLVYKESDELSKINGIVVFGLEYRMKVVEYGKD